MSDIRRTMMLQGPRISHLAENRRKDSPAVDRSLLEAVARSGVRREQIVSEITQLHPWESASEFFRRQGWMEEPPTAHASLFYLPTRSFGSEQGFQEVVLAHVSRGVSLRTVHATGQVIDKMQSIDMDKHGNVLGNTTYCTPFPSECPDTEG